MKSILFLFAAFAAASCAFGAAATTHKPTSSERIAVDVVKKNITDANLDAELAKIGIEAGRKHDEIVALVKAMRAVVADGVVFQKILDRTRKITDSAF